MSEQRPATQTEAAGGVPGSAPVGRPLLSVLSDAYDAICSLESEGWDMLSDETKDEAQKVRELILTFALGRPGHRAWD